MKHSATFPGCRALLAIAATTALACGLPVQAQAPTEISYFYPVAVGGPITKTIDGYAADFNKANPSIKVTQIYAGTFQETIVKARTAHKSGQPPVTSVLLSTYMLTRTTKTPSCRSTTSSEAGLDPNRPPTTWAELKDYASKLTKTDASGKVTQYGVQIPSSGFPYWLFQTLTTTNDAVPASETGTALKFDDPKVIEALQYWVDLGKAGVHPTGVVEWGTTPRDFSEKKVAIMFTTTGNLTNVKNNAKFDFGVAQIPGNKRKGGSPTGGGNFHIFKKASPAQQEAAFRFIKWITEPERAAQWSMDTGYVAVSAASYSTDTLRKYGRDFPAALVARDQLPVLVAEFSTHDNQRVTKALNDGLQAALTGTKSPAQAMQDAQREAERLLRSYK